MLSHGNESISKLLKDATIADLVFLYRTTQHLEQSVFEKVTAPRISKRAENLLDEMFVNPVSEHQVAIMQELERRKPANHQEERARTAALTDWAMLDNDFVTANKLVANQYLSDFIRERGLHPAAFQGDDFS